jgi:hypothetical protein
MTKPSRQRATKSAMTSEKLAAALRYCSRSRAVKASLILL